MEASGAGVSCGGWAGAGGTRLGALILVTIALLAALAVWDVADGGSVWVIDVSVWAVALSLVAVALPATMTFWDVAGCGNVWVIGVNVWVAAGSSKGS